jgi:hypothetical protein
VNWNSFSGTETMTAVVPSSSTSTIIPASDEKLLVSALSHSPARGETAATVEPGPVVLAGADA